MHTAAAATTPASAVACRCRATGTSASPPTGSQITLKGPNDPSAGLAAHYRYEGGRAHVRGWNTDPTNQQSLGFRTTWDTDELGYETKLPTVRDPSGTPATVFDLDQGRDLEGNVPWKKFTMQSGRNTKLVRGGREGTHWVTDAANSDPLRARQRLSLPQTPEVRVDLEVPAGAFSDPCPVPPDFKLPGGGTQRSATGPVPARVVREFRR